MLTSLGWTWRKGMDLVDFIYIRPNGLGPNDGGVLNKARLPFYHCAITFIILSSGLFRR